MRSLLKISAWFVIGMLAIPFTTLPSASAQTASETCANWKISGVRRADGIYSEVVIPSSFLFPYFDPAVPPSETSEEYKYYHAIFYTPIFECNKRQKPPNPAPPRAPTGASTAEAVKQCTVNAAVNTIGGKILQGLSDAGNEALGYLKNAGKDLVKGFNLGNALNLGLNIALPGVGSFIGSAFSGVGDALGLGEIFGGGGGSPQPQNVTEVGQQLGHTKNIQFGNCLKTVKEEAFKIALQTFRKQLLDRMVDDVVAWISDGRDPKFITDFRGFLEDAGQAAVGDTVRAVGLAELCAPFKYRLPPLLRPVPTFTQQVSCTLNGIVRNIEGFYKDFRSGGPLAYVESLRPNNNPVGALLATRDQILRETAKKQEAAALAASAGGGYKSVEECLEWTATSYRISLGSPKSTSRAVNSLFNYPNPLFPPPPGSSEYQSVANALGGGPIVFTCSRKEITLPPGGTQQIAGAALTADTQVLANASDLSRYSKAIFDATANRIIKAGVKALRGNPSDLRSESTTGRPPEEYPEGDPFRDYGNEYNNSTNFNSQLRSELATEIAGARSDVTTASTTLTQLIALNNQLIATTTALSDCESSRFLGITCENTSSTLTLARVRKLQFDSDRANLTATLTQLTQIESELSDNAEMGESELSSLLASITSARSALRTMSDRFTLLGALIGTQLDRNRQALQTCQTGTYTCSWTPPSP